jgi:hypothetical protein
MYDQALPDWSRRWDHITRRSWRNPRDIDIKEEWANEAYCDENAAVSDPDFASRSGRSKRTIGYSPSAGFVITVITYVEADHVWGATAWHSGVQDLEKYRQREGNDA